jgi:Protein of unknown function (DUF3179)
MRGRIALVLAAASLIAAGCGGGGHKDTRTGAPASQPARPPTGVSFSTEGWSTDWSKHSVPYSEFFSGGPQRDGIPPIDNPKVVPIAKMRGALDDRAPVMVVQQGQAVRAYPLEILVWHEIVNDVLGGRPIAVTYCPLCNSALVFDRRVGRLTLRFGTTGNLRNSDLVMWDRQTESWWQQVTGQAVVGKFTGTQLTALPSETLSWEVFKRRYPAGTVLSLHTGFDRPYGENPYAGYETDPSPSSFFTGKTDSSLPAKERVAAVFAGGRALVVPFSKLRKSPVVQTQAGATPVAVFYDPHVRSVLDSTHVSRSIEVGTATAFDRRIGGRTLDFAPRAGQFVDRQTGSTWDITGTAVAGRLRGQKLRPIRHDEQFWFALAAFVPHARILR